MLVRAARAALALGIIAAATVHAIASELAPVRLPFFTENMVEPALRHLVLALMGGTFLVIAAATLVMTRRDPDRSPAGAEWLARLLCPLLMLPVAMALLRHDYADDATEALVLAMFGLATERLTRECVGAWRDRPPELGSRITRLPRAFFARPRLVFGTLLVLTIGHATYMALWEVFAHQRFATYGYDLGQYDQVFQSVLGGRPLRLPALGWDQNWGGFNGHADLATFYLMPIYAIHPRAETLLVLQASLLASGAIPVFWLARNRLPLHYAFGLGLAWLLYAPLHGAQLYDVHMQPFGCVWVMWSIAAVDAKRFKLYWLFFVFAILCREDVSIGLASLGAFMFLSGYRVRTGIATALVATAYFLFLRFVLMTNQYFADTFKLLYPPGETGFIPVIKTIVSNPGYTLRTLVTWEKIRYVCQVFAPLVFLPLRRPLHWLLMLPGFLLTLIATAYLPPIQISFQYVCNWAAYVFAATAFALAAFKDDDDGRARRAAAAWAVMAATVLACVQWGAYSPYPTVKGGFSDVPFLAPTAADKQREKDLQELMKKVPAPVALCAADRIQAHVTWHLNTWSLRDGLAACEYLIYSTLPGDLGNDRGMNAVASGQYELVEKKGDVMLAKKKATP